MSLLVPRYPQIILRWKLARSILSLAKPLFLGGGGGVVRAYCTLYQFEEEAILAWSIPKSVKPPSWLGLVDHCRKFVKIFVIIAKPLTESGIPIQWLDKQWQPLNILSIHVLCSSAVLSLPISAKFLSLQHQEFPVYEPELNAFTFAVDKWQHYFEQSPLVIKMDHESIKYLLQHRLICSANRTLPSSWVSILVTMAQELLTELSIGPG